MSEALQKELELRYAQLIGKDTVIATLQAELAELQATVPDLESRMRLKQKNELMASRQRELENQVSEFSNLGKAQC